MSTPIREDPQSSSPFTNSSPFESGSTSNGISPKENHASRSGHLNSATRRETPLAREYSFEGVRKDSISSRGSWIKRLSTVQTSNHGSPRSSVGPDSPSLNFSHGSTAHMLNTNGSPTQLPPNKLVKRTTSGRVGNGDAVVSRPSRSQVPTLRRPATSHQRSVTLQQHFRHAGQEPMDTSAQLSSSPTSETRVQIPNSSYPTTARNTYWRPYFESRVTKLTKERPSGKSFDSTPDGPCSTSKRILLPDGNVPAPTLLKPGTIMESNAKTITSWNEAFPVNEAEFNTPVSSDELSPSNLADSEPHKRVRRSLSINFSSPTRWISRTGSLRAGKGKGTIGNMGKRYVSAPVSTLPGRATMSSHSASTSRRKDIMDPSIYQNQALGSHDGPLSQNPFTASNPTPRTRSRNTSSPLPSLSRLSSFNMDLGRMGLSSSNGQQHSPTSPAVSVNNATLPSVVSSRDKPSVKQPLPVVIHQYKSPRHSEVIGSDRASTLVESDSDNRGFASGDDDEMDFQSDTVFDSFRTGATGSVRSRNPPLEMMFDESPPSAGSKPRSPMPLDVAATAMFRDSDDRILEEDEGMVTPIKDRRILVKDKFNTPTRTTFASTADDAIRSSPPSFSLATKDFARLSIEDDDEDEDWTKDDESILMASSLSPASRPSSSVNSRRVSPALRNALSGPFDERPRSVFDWSEPLSSEKTDLMGNSPRPKTVHGKQALDGRGGRSVGRKGPSALHIRSQSVPVVPDAAGHREFTKLTPKFGTWGLGAKGVSEDWDNDFEFMEVDEPEDGNDNMSSSAMLIPPAIQASQASVVGHVGQIREICLLVEDLKRLRGQAREKGILDGPSANLWRDADGIIALAIPDEEDQTLSPPQSPEVDVFNHEIVDNRHRDGGLEIEYTSNRRANTEAGQKSETNFALGQTIAPARRQSVFSPEDDIFGAGGIDVSRHLEENQNRSKRTSHQSSIKDSTDVARSVMKHIHQHRAISDPLRSELPDNPAKMPFDTTSLRDLVHRANHLRNTLAEIIRKADGAISPQRSPMPARESSPAFTRVFTDPLASPPKHLTRTQSNNSILSNSIDASPTRSLGQRMHMMTVV